VEGVTFSETMLEDFFFGVSSTGTFSIVLGASSLLGVIEGVVAGGNGCGLRYGVVLGSSTTTEPDQDTDGATTTPSVGTLTPE
jgi:hypothetical protein